MTEPQAAESLFHAVGGEATFRRLVAGFYRRVAADPVLLPLYPEDDLPGAEDRLGLFLMQYWGGPTTYSEQRGHPRLRMRHAPFVIGAPERDAWLRNMRAALDELGMAPVHEAAVWEHLERAALLMQNVPDDTARESGARPG
jgi:hemoglobin